jgi:hypothetical protein
MTEPEIEQDRNCNDDLQSLDKIAGEEVRNEVLRRSVETGR